MEGSKAPAGRQVWLPLEGKLSQPISREAVTDEVEPAAFDRLSTNGDADTSSVIRLAGDAGCHLPLQGKACLTGLSCSIIKFCEEQKKTEATLDLL